MNQLRWPTLLGAIVLACAAQAQEAQSLAPAEAAATRWLQLLDAADYAATWDQAASLFRAAVPQARWEEAARRARLPFGALQTRTLKSTTLTHSLPGVPDGEYVVIEFNSAFTNKAQAVETVTPMKDADGSWRVSGYFIR